MSTEEFARRSFVDIKFDGVDITGEIAPYVLSVTYIDSEEDEADDLQIALQDRDNIWMENWLSAMINAASAKSGAKGLKIEAVFHRQNWNGDGKTDTMSSGPMELDAVDANGPPSALTIKATSLPFSSQIRQTETSRAWESYYLSKIAEEIATTQGLTCSYLSDKDPFYRRVEQFRMSDISFLSRLCHEAGLSLKAAGTQIVLFNQQTYEAKDALLTIKRGSKIYTKYSLSTGKAEREYSSCRVSYVSPTDGLCIEATVKVEDYDEQAQTNQQLEITAAVASIAEAQDLAAKYLRLYNKYAKTVTFTLPGNPSAVAGLTVFLEDWGAFDGKYIIKQAKHTVTKNGGYTTQIICRAVIPYFDPPVAAAAQPAATQATTSQAASLPKLRTVSEIKEALQKNSTIVKKNTKTVAVALSKDVDTGINANRFVADSLKQAKVNAIAQSKPTLPKKGSFKVINK